MSCQEPERDSDSITHSAEIKDTWHFLEGTLCTMFYPTCFPAYFNHTPSMRYPYCLDSSTDSLIYSWTHPLLHVVLSLAADRGPLLQLPQVIRVTTL